MRKRFAFLAAGAALIAAPAAAQIIPTTVTATNTNYGGDLSYLNDGFIPANGTAYNAAGTEVFFGPLEFPSTLVPPVFTFNFGGMYSIDSMLATVDNNDDYMFEFFDSAGNNIANDDIFSSDGGVGNGVETFTHTYGSPIFANGARVSGNVGDFRYSLGEVQFFGSAVTAAVPEPATWVMMLLGFGGIGFTMRRQRKALVAA